VSGRSASVTEKGVLRAIEFTPRLTKPTPSHVVATILKSIADPIENDDTISRPSVMVLLETVQINEKELKEITKRMSKYDIKVVTMEVLWSEMPELAKSREDFPDTPVQCIPVITKPSPSANEPVPFNPPPLRGCFTCKKDIPGKASQCSVCKAVIYCSGDCAVRSYRLMFRKRIGQTISKVVLNSKKAWSA
jgi:hypothetical protein